MNTSKNIHLSQYLLLAFVAIFVLTFFNSCQDSISIHDTLLETEDQYQATSKLFEGLGIIEGEYIVIFEEQWDGQISEQIGHDADLLRDEILSTHNIREDSVLNRYRYAIKGFAAMLSDEQVKALKNDPRIARVSPNAFMRLGINSAAKNESIETEAAVNSSLASIQTGHWGVARVGGPLDGTGMTAYILDTGIELDHPDLNVDVDNSASFIAGESANDGNGHGTHVAGIVASTGSTTGIQGVAAGATVVAIKICPNSGPCPVNSIINGVDYISIRAKPEDIVNMSIWGPVNLDIDNAINNAADNGIRFTLIAGNAADDANNYSPGRVVHDNTWTMSAMNSNDEFATSFSNYGNPPINYVSPGVDILSLWRNGGTNTISGTSMAAPHVAGILLATGTEPATDGTVSNDPSPPADPIAVVPTDPTLTITISGPTVIETSGEYTWTAEASGGYGNYTYDWYRRIDHQTLTCSYQTDWGHVGTGKTYSSYVSSSGDYDFRLKVEVQSANETASDQIKVYPVYNDNLICPTAAGQDENADIAVIEIPERYAITDNYANPFNPALITGNLW